MYIYIKCVAKYHFHITDRSGQCEKFSGLSISRQNLVHGSRKWVTYFTTCTSILPDACQLVN